MTLIEEAEKQRAARQHAQAKLDELHEAMLAEMEQCTNAYDARMWMRAMIAVTKLHGGEVPTVAEAITESVVFLSRVMALHRPNKDETLQQYTHRVFDWIGDHWRSEK